MPDITLDKMFANRVPTESQLVSVIHMAEQFNNLAQIINTTVPRCPERAIILSNLKTLMLCCNDTIISGGLF